LVPVPGPQPTLQVKRSAVLLAAALLSGRMEPLQAARGSRLVLEELLSLARGLSQGGRHMAPLTLHEPPSLQRAQQSERTSEPSQTSIPH